MTLQEIKDAIEAGKKVYWSNKGYVVHKATSGEYLITFTSNQSTIGLTHRDGVTMNGKEEDFFTTSLKLRYLETCSPDYFNGYGGEVIAVMVDGRMTMQEVKNELHHYINSNELWVNGEPIREAGYQELIDCAEELFNPADYNKTFSPSLPIGDESDCYAYFGIYEEDE